MRAKITWFALLAGLLSPGSLSARNPEPLRIAPPADARIAHPLGRIVLVHGFLETGMAFSTLRKRLEAQGYDCLVPKLSPSDGRGGLEALAEGLKRDIDAAYGPDIPIRVVGFSMGGVVSRYYLQKLGGAARCEKFFTIASPHNGTHAAWIYPTRGAAQMRPGSKFLKALDESDHTLGSMPVVSYRTPLDLVILPASSSVWQRAENFHFPVLLHPLMLSSAKVLDDLEKRLLD
jgi:triacylglycerol lipase